MLVAASIYIYIAPEPIWSLDYVGKGLKKNTFFYMSVAELAFIEDKWSIKQRQIDKVTE